MHLLQLSNRFRVGLCFAVFHTAGSAALPVEATVSDCARQVKITESGSTPTQEILLLGDSTVIGNVLRLVRPAGPHLEARMRADLDAQPGVPPFRILNLGVGGGYIRQFLSSGRYDATVAKRRDVGFVMLRFGLNDYFRLPEFAADFPTDYAQLVQRLRADHPRATLVVMTVIPYHSPKITAAINHSVRGIAQSLGLPLLDITAHYEAELRDSPHRLSYRSVPLAAIPSNDLPAVAKHTFLVDGIEQVVVVDELLDRRLGSLPQWYADRHPNFDGYRVIADLSSRYLADCIRAARR